MMDGKHLKDLENPGLLISRKCNTLLTESALDPLGIVNCLQTKCLPSSHPS